MVFGTESEEGIEGDEGDEEGEGDLDLMETTNSQYSTPTCALVAYPLSGRHVSFQGNLLHGVPAELSCSPPGSVRLSVLVNVWTDHQPEGVVRMTGAEIRRIKGWPPEGQVTDGGSLARDLRPVQMEREERGGVKLEEHIVGETAMLPSRDILKKAAEKRDVVFVAYIDK